MTETVQWDGHSTALKPRILRQRISGEDAGKTIKQYLMQKIGFSSRQLSRFKYRKDGILLNGEKRYVNAPLREGDLLEIRLTRGGEPVEEHPHDALRRAKDGGSRPEDGYRAARDGRLQKIWAPPAPWLRENYPFRVLYEDEDILVADKPPGVVCHPSPGHFDDTLSNQLAEHLGRTGQELDVRVTGRLDRDTSGIVIFALNTETAAQLIKQRQASEMQKLYIARVRGHFSTGRGTEQEGFADRPDGPGETEEVVDRPGGPVGTEAVVCRPCRPAELEEIVDQPGGPAGTEAVVGRLRRPAELEGVVDRPLRRESRESFRMIIAEDGKPARTFYRVLAELEDGTSLLACRIEHGRTHQIRVHMASLGHPIVGDRLYGPEAADSAGERKNRLKAAENAIDVRQDLPAESGPLMLHACRAVLLQPFTGEEIRIEAALPDWAGALCLSDLAGTLCLPGQADRS